MRRGLTGFLLLAWLATAVFAGVQTARIAWLEAELTRRTAAGSVHFDTGNSRSEQTAGENPADDGKNSGDADSAAESDIWGDIMDSAGGEDTSEDKLFMKNLVDNALASMMADPVADNARKSRRQLKREMLQDMGIR
ncbi:MAG TPA: hypothetical protein PLX03_03925, partial [Candidatus Hydrogenedentes bacterium]|nr:hypothetical protein [Candidatus Hydrogenedentota bacterium]